MSQLVVSPADVAALGAQARSTAGTVEPGSLGAVLALGVEALGGLSSAAALAGVGTVWVAMVERLATAWDEFAAITSASATVYDDVECRVDAAAR